ncbi:MAG: BrnA antitoxin family protein [Cyanobacteria bacterium J06555_13]
MKMERSNPIPPDLQAEVEALANLPDDQIRTDDIPEVHDWRNAKRGMFYQPAQQQQIALGIDADLIEWFKTHSSNDEGYETSINNVLREYVAQRKAS